MLKNGSYDLWWSFDRNGFAVLRMDCVNVTDSITLLIVPLSTYPRELTILESETALVSCDLLQLGT